MTVHSHPVRVRAYYLPAETFGSAPMFLLTTDIEGNDPMSRSISQRLYDSDVLTRIAQYIILGVGGRRFRSTAVKCSVGECMSKGVRGQ